MSSCSKDNPVAFKASEQDKLNEQELAQLAKALAHPARVRILRVLHALHNVGGCLNSSLVSELGLAQSTVSEHLRVLKEAGFITAEPDPPKVCYRINQEKVEHFNTLFIDSFM